MNLTRLLARDHHEVYIYIYIASKDSHPSKLTISARIKGSIAFIVIKISFEENLDTPPNI